MMRMLTSRPSDAICELVGSRPYRFVEGRREDNLTFANTDTLDQLLLRRFGGKVGRGLTAELSGRHDFLIEWSFASGVLRCPGPHGSQGAREILRYNEA